MKPGRELDALVAEKVMGWKFLGGALLSPKNQETPTEYDWQKPTSKVPFYSTDIAAAWEVAMKLGNVIIHTYWVGEPKFVEASIVGSDAVYKTAAGDSAPHAICLAALKVVGAKLD